MTAEPKQQSGVPRQIFGESREISRILEAVMPASISGYCWLRLLLTDYMGRGAAKVRAQSPGEVLTLSWGFKKLLKKKKDKKLYFPCQSKVSGNLSLFPLNWGPLGPRLCVRKTDLQELTTWVGWLVPQSCPTLYNSVDCSLPGSPVHGIFQARILEWIAIL